MTLNDMWKLLLARGGMPNDVLISRTGDKMPAAEALKKDHQWDIIYFRSDGYTIAADYYLAPYIIQMATDPEKPWVGKIYRGELQPKPLTLTTA